MPASLGIRIKQLLDKRGLNQTQFSKILNVSESTISLYISGKHQPDYETLFRIADYFEVSIDYLLGRNDVPPFIKQVNDDHNVLSQAISCSQYSDLPEDVIKLLKELEDFIIHKYRR